MVGAAMAVTAIVSAGVGVVRVAGAEHTTGDRGDTAIVVPIVNGEPVLPAGAAPVGVDADRGSSAASGVPAPSPSSAAPAAPASPLAPAPVPVPPIQTAAWPDPAPVVDRYVLAGDSLAQEVAPVLQMLLPDMPLVPKFWGGTAPCDWVGVDLEASPSSVVVVTFTGNSLTACMEDGAGGHLADQALVDRYRTDLGVLVDRARQAGARVVLVGQPHRAASFAAEFEVDGINQVLLEYAAAFPHVSYVDAGARVEHPDGTYADRLPCSELDPVCAPDGTTVVRGDGVHFCPAAGKNPCPVWSSGAVRFGLGIADGIHAAATDTAG